MIVSVITCFYEGQKYMAHLFEMIARNAETAKKAGIVVEYILVNDSPWCEINMPYYKQELFDVIIINNTVNCGIHFSRVAGISKCNGKYLLILDQDDEIADDYIISQISCIKNRNVVVCNGVKEFAWGKRLIYKNIMKHILINQANVYLKAANQIVSPGQCLIKKESIPKEWVNNILVNNGSDDLFLWLIYLSKKQKFAINRNILYIHKQVRTNLSNDLEKMCRSDLEMCDISEVKKILPIRYIEKRRRMCRFLEKTEYSQRIKHLSDLKYLDILIMKIFAKYI